MNESDLTAKGFVPDGHGGFLKPKRKADLLTPNRGAAAKLECHPGIGTLEPAQVERLYPDRVLVRVTSVRKRLLDEDNLCEKYHVDCLRYSCVIQEDRPGKAKIEVCQRKAEPGEAEHVVIEVFEL